MKQDVKAQWLRALRSGAYTQGHNALRNWDEGDMFCCLGVLCDVINPKGWNKPALVDNVREFTYAGTSSDEKLPDALGAVLEISDGQENHLVSMNDTLDATFREIADWIEDNL